MKKFKQFIKTIKKAPPTIPAVIHFKHISVPKTKAVTPSPIHFKHVKEDTQPAKPVVGHINDWHETNDNSHLTKQKPRTEEHDDEIADKITGKQNLNPDDAKVITKYTGLGSHLLNGGLLDNNLAERHKPTVNSLDNSINNNRIQVPVSLYSGVGFDPEKHIDENGQMHSPAFISATHSKGIARGFASGESDRDPNAPLDNIRHIIHFHLNLNDPAMHISHLSGSPEEYETIIGRGQTLQHHGTSDYAHPEHKKIYRIHHMSIVPPQGK